MFYRFTFIFLMLAACTSKQKTEVSETERPFNNFLDAYYEERLKLFPVEATQIGDYKYNNLLPNDISVEFRTGLKNFYRRYQSELNTYLRDSLSDQERVSYDIFKREMEINLKSLTFNDHYIPVQQFWGMTLTIPQIGSGKSYQPFKTAKDYDDFLQRIDGFAVWMDTAIVNMRKGLAVGHTFPKILMERVLPQARDMMVTDVKKSIFWEPIANMSDSISAADKSRFIDAYTKAINAKIIPSY